jgi:hypothetical protein
MTKAEFPAMISQSVPPETAFTVDTGQPKVITTATGFVP